MLFGHIIIDLSDLIIGAIHKLINIADSHTTRKISPGFNYHENP